MSDPTPPWESVNPTPPWEATAKAQDKPISGKSDESFFGIMGRRASNAWDSLPEAQPVPENSAEFLKQSKEAIPGAMKAMSGGFGIVASPLGAAGENLEYRAAKAAGVPEDKSLKLAKDTGDVSEALLGIVPGAKKVPKLIADTGEAGSVGALKILDKGREAINAKADAMAMNANKTPVTSDALRQESHIAYKAADAAGGVYSPKITNSFIDSSKSLLKQTAKGKAVFGQTPIDDIVGKIEKFRDQPLTLAEAQELDQGFGELANQHINLKTGKLDSVGQKYYELQQKLRGLVDNPKDEDIMGGRAGIDASKRGRELWAQSARLRDIEDIIQRANLTDNPISASKNGFRNLYMNKARLRGFSPEEQALIRQAAQSGATVNLMHMFGSRLVPIAATVSGGGLGADLIGGGIAHAASSGARGLANKLYSKRPQRVLDAVSSRDITPLPVNTGTPLETVIPQIAP